MKVNRTVDIPRADIPGVQAADGSILVKVLSYNKMEMKTAGGIVLPGTASSNSDDTYGVAAIGRVISCGRYADKNGVPRDVPGFPLQPGTIVFLAPNNPWGTPQGAVFRSIDFLYAVPKDTKTPWLEE